jgi:hypothetical protein
LISLFEQNHCSNHSELCIVLKTWRISHQSRQHYVRGMHLHTFLLPIFLWGTFLWHMEISSFLFMCDKRSRTFGESHEVDGRSEAIEQAMAFWRIPCASLGRSTSDISRLEEFLGHRAVVITSAPFCTADYCRLLVVSVVFSSFPCRRPKPHYLGCSRRTRDWLSQEAPGSMIAISDFRMPYLLLVLLLTN